MAATTFDVNQPAFLISGENASVTDVTTYDASGTFTSGRHWGGSAYFYAAMIGVIYRKVLCTRFQITPTTTVKSVTLDFQHNNKAHGTYEYVTFYAKASSSASDWPASISETSSTVIGGLTSGTGNSHTLFKIDITPTRQPFYIYVWATLREGYSSDGEHDQWIKSVYSVSCEKGGVNLYVKTGASTWKQATAVYVKINSTTWKEVSGLYAKTNSTTWKEAT